MQQDDISRKLENAVSRINALEGHVTRIDGDIKEIHKLLGNTATKADVVAAGNRIEKKIDNAVGSIVETVVSVFRTR
jgi:uncharacterized protein (UPF0335 family)